jgi:hypothetical protein
MTKAPPAKDEIIIEGDTGDGRNPYFPPTGTKIRGKLVANDVREPTVAMSRFRNCVFPGQRLHFDQGSRKLWLEETLYGDGCALERSAIAGLYKLAEPRTDFSGEHDLSTVLFWMKRLVDAGLARLIHGQFPDKLPGKPRTEWFSQSESKDEQKIDRLTKLVETLAALQLANLPADKRQVVEALLKEE